MTLILLSHYVQAGLDFLTALFAKHDLDQDQALSPQELVSLFSICPLNPWGPEVYHQTPTNHKNWVGLPGYLALWHLKTLLEPHHCSQLLAHLGYDYHAPALPARPPPLVATKDRKVHQPVSYSAHYTSSSWRRPPSKRAKQSTHVLSWDQEMLERPPFVR